jgi:phosphatidylglycerol lysyltransferase
MSLGELKPAVRALAPAGTAAATFAAGAMLLISGATPNEADRFAWMFSLVPPELINASHFASSIIGLLMLLLADGLRRRVDAAWAATLFLAALAGVLALLKGFNWEETAVLAVLCLALIPLRPAFNRTARLTNLEVTPGWLASAIAIALGAAGLALWSFRDVSYSDELWWRLMANADASRALRAFTGLALALLCIGVWRLVATPHTPRVIGDKDPDFAKVRAILASAEEAEPEANLALLGDKRFLFSQSGESFLMFGVRGRSWIALGPPVGKRAERMELLWRFRELADVHAARKGVYGIGPDLLPEVVEMGLAIQKIGEHAALALEDFSMAGRKREVLRRNWRRASEAGAVFEAVGPEAVPALMPQLKAVSDAWLEGHAGGDKSFAMGGFSESYVAEFPCALVWVDGELAAFATLWPTADKAVFSMDLMRYGAEAPKNVMDFLFVELLLWGQREGYEAFSFGSAPLAGLEGRRLSPLMSRVGRLVFERGEEFYNFQGVRRYKAKYDPAWEPRYIAAPHKWSIPLLMADVSLLTSGGVAGLVGRGRRGGAETPPERTGAALPGGPAVPGLDPQKIDQVDQHHQHDHGRQHHDGAPGDQARPAAEIGRPGPAPAGEGGQADHGQEGGEGGGEVQGRKAPLNQS